MRAHVDSSVVEPVRPITPAQHAYLEAFDGLLAGRGREDHVQTLGELVTLEANVTPEGQRGRTHRTDGARPQGHDRDVSRWIEMALGRP